MDAAVLCPGCSSEVGYPDPVVDITVTCENCGTQLTIHKAPPLSEGEARRRSRPLYQDPPPPGFLNSFLICLGLVLMLQLVPGFVGGFRAAQSAHAAHPKMDGAAVLQTREFAQGILIWVSGAQAASWVIVLLVLPRVLGPSWPRIIAFRRPSPIHFWLALLGLPGLMIVATGVDGLAKHCLPQFIDLEQSFRLFAKWPLFAGLAVIGLGPGISEELWFRGFMGRGVVARYGVVPGVVLTSLLFGLVHLEPHHMVSTFVMGMLLHGTYLASRSLFVPMLLHILNNSLSILSVRNPQLGFTEATPGEIPDVVYFAAVVLVATVGWAFYKTRARLVDDPEGGAPWRPEYPGVELPPASSSTRVVTELPKNDDELKILLGALGTAVLFFACVAIPAALSLARTAG